MLYYNEIGNKLNYLDRRIRNLQYEIINRCAEYYELQNILKGLKEASKELSTTLENLNKKECYNV